MELVGWGNKSGVVPEGGGKLVLRVGLRSGLLEAEEELADGGKGKTEAKLEGDGKSEIRGGIEGSSADVSGVCRANPQRGVECADGGWGVGRGAGVAAADGGTGPPLLGWMEMGDVGGCIRGRGGKKERRGGRVPGLSCAFLRLQ
jgi:hypothetical protein